MVFLDGVAASTRKPLECCFSLVKGRFRKLSNGLEMQHEDGCWYALHACAILHNTCIDDSFFEGEYDLERLLVDDAEFTSATNSAKRKGDALIHFLLDL